MAENMQSYLEASNSDKSELFPVWFNDKQNAEWNEAEKAFGIVKQCSNVDSKAKIKCMKIDMDLKIPEGTWLNFDLMHWWFIDSKDFDEFQLNIEAIDTSPMPESVRKAIKDIDDLTQKWDTKGIDPSSWKFSVWLKANPRYSNRNFTIEWMWWWWSQDNINYGLTNSFWLPDNKLSVYWNVKWNPEGEWYFQTWFTHSYDLLKKYSPDWLIMDSSLMDEWIALKINSHWSVKRHVTRVKEMIPGWKSITETLEYTELNVWTWVKATKKWKNWNVQLNASTKVTKFNWWDNPDSVSSQAWISANHETEKETALNWSFNFTKSKRWDSESITRTAEGWFATKKGLKWDISLTNKTSKWEYWGSDENSWTISVSKEAWDGWTSWSIWKESNVDGKHEHFTVWRSFVKDWVTWWHGLSYNNRNDLYPYVSESNQFNLQGGAVTYKMKYWTKKYTHDFLISRWLGSTQDTLFKYWYTWEKFDFGISESLLGENASITHKGKQYETTAYHSTDNDRWTKTNWVKIKFSWEPIWNPWNEKQLKLTFDVKNIASDWWDKKVFSVVWTRSNNATWSNLSAQLGVNSQGGHVGWDASVNYTSWDNEFSWWVSREDGGNSFHLWVTQRWKNADLWAKFTHWPDWPNVLLSVTMKD